MSRELRRSVRVLAKQLDSPTLKRPAPDPEPTPKRVKEDEGSLWKIKMKYDYETLDHNTVVIGCYEEYCTCKPLFADVLEEIRESMKDKIVHVIRISCVCIAE